MFVSFNIYIYWQYYQTLTFVYKNRNIRTIKEIFPRISKCIFYSIKQELFFASRKSVVATNEKIHINKKVKYDTYDFIFYISYELKDFFLLISSSIWSG